jgi:hypothetical protein
VYEFDTGQATFVIQLLRLYFIFYLRLLLHSVCHFLANCTRKETRVRVSSYGLSRRGVGDSNKQPAAHFARRRPESSRHLAYSGGPTIVYQSQIIHLFNEMNHIAQPLLATFLTHPAPNTLITITFHQ